MNSAKSSLHDASLNDHSSTEWIECVLGNLASLGVSVVEAAS
jgi:hypothetical protein